MLTQNQLQEKILDAIAAAEIASNELQKAAREYGDAEHAYRQARAVAYLRFSTQRQDNKKLTEPHLAAMVDQTTSSEMLRVRLAEAGKESTFQLVLSLRGQISALQSLLRNNTEEAKAVAYGQRIGA